MFVAGAPYVWPLCDNHPLPEGRVCHGVAARFVWDLFMLQGDNPEGGHGSE